MEQETSTLSAQKKKRRNITKTDVQEFLLVDDTSCDILLGIELVGNQPT